MNLRTTAALILTATTLAACTDKEMARGLALLTGEVNTLNAREAELRASYDAMQTKGTATEAELNALRQQYAALALQTVASYEWKTA